MLSVACFYCYAEYGYAQCSCFYYHAECRGAHFSTPALSRNRLKFTNFLQKIVKILIGALSTKKLTQTVLITLVIRQHYLNNDYKKFISRNGLKKLR
jgi:hypothetical protein